MYWPLMQAYRQCRRRHPPARARLRCRPSVEALECRLVPSVSPLHVRVDFIAVQSAPQFAQTQPLQATEVGLFSLVPLQTSVPMPDQPVPTPAPVRGVPAELAQTEAVQNGAAETVKPPVIPPPESRPTDEVESETPTASVPQSCPAPVAGVYVFRPETAPKHDGLPLLVWVMGLSCLLMLREDRTRDIPALCDPDALRPRRPTDRVPAPRAG